MPSSNNYDVEAEFVKLAIYGFMFLICYESIKDIINIYFIRNKK
jgi:hypothetical protein